MKRTAKDNRPPVKPVERVELSSRHLNIRVVILIVCVVVACVAFALAIQSFLSADSGWRQIRVASGTVANCSDEFVFQYDIGREGIAASAEYKQITALYTEAAVKAYRLFHATEAFDGVSNVQYLNAHPGEEVRVDPVLYRAFEAMEASGSRALYLGPVYEGYASLFSSDADWQAEQSDPHVLPELSEEYAAFAAFARDDSAMHLTLLGDDRVRLDLSDEYLAFARNAAVSTHLDFAYLKNAFIADYFADVMTENGHTAGSFTSFDGYVRNMDTSGTEYGFNLFVKKGNAAYTAGVLRYSRPVAIAFFRAYPLNDSLDVFRFYRYANGTVRTLYVDLADGLDRTAAEQLVGYVYGGRCADAALALASSFVGDGWDIPAVNEKGVETVYERNYALCMSDRNATVEELYSSDDVKFSLLRDAD